MLETPRLVLRPHEVGDYEDMAAMWADPRVVRFIGGQPRDAQDAWFTLLRLRGLWSVLGYGYWIARERESGAFVGELGFADFKRGLPEQPAGPEAGWALSPSHWGRGLASEALAAALAWLDRERGLAASCVIEPAHAASLRVAEKCGFRRQGQASYRGTELVVLYRAAGGS